jgi:MerR family transcriptional regulator, light-induced transcriptional regulator
VVGSTHVVLPVQRQGSTVSDAVRSIGPSDHEAPPLDRGAPHAATALAFLDELLQGNRAAAFALVQELVDEGVPIEDLYLHVFEPVLHETGRRWQHNRVSVAQEHYVTAATQLAMSQLYPRIFRAPRIGRTLVATCVGGELHEVGLRMVADLFELAGWDTHFLGADTPSQAVAEFAAARQADLIAVSATLPSHRDEVSRMVAVLRASSHTPILVGGRLFHLEPGLSRTIGADATASSAAEAVRVGNMLVNDSP